jgi:hypothetical protein
VDSPFGITRLDAVFRIFGLELGGHGRGEESAGLESGRWDDFDDFDGEVVAHMDDTAGQGVAFGSVGGFESGDLRSDLGEGGRGDRVWVRVDGVHLELLLASSCVLADLTLLDGFGRI